jgi:hypothetical protein
MRELIVDFIKVQPQEPDQLADVDEAEVHEPEGHDAMLATLPFGQKLHVTGTDGILGTAKEAVASVAAGSRRITEVLEKAKKLGGWLTRRKGPGQPNTGQQGTSAQALGEAAETPGLDRQRKEHGPGNDVAAADPPQTDLEKDAVTDEARLRDYLSRHIRVTFDFSHSGQNNRLRKLGTKLERFVTNSDLQDSSYMATLGSLSVAFGPILPVSIPLAVAAAVPFPKLARKAVGVIRNRDFETRVQLPPDAVRYLCEPPQSLAKVGDQVRVVAAAIAAHGGGGLISLTRTDLEGTIAAITQSDTSRTAERAAFFLFRGGAIVLTVDCVANYVHNAELESAITAMSFGAIAFLTAMVERRWPRGPSDEDLWSSVA